jgi:DNA replication protein DnaC
MSNTQHARIVELCTELRLAAVPDLYGAAAQAAAAGDASFSDFLEETLKGEREVRRGRAREMFARTAGFPAVKTLDGYDFVIPRIDDLAPRSRMPSQRSNRPEGFNRASPLYNA